MHSSDEEKKNIFYKRTRVKSMTPTLVLKKHSSEANTIL